MRLCVGSVSVCVCGREDAEKCEEQFQMVTLQVRETETEEKKGKTSQKGSRAAQTEMEEHRAGNAKLTLPTRSVQRTGVRVLK